MFGEPFNEDYFYSLRLCVPIFTVFVYVFLGPERHAVFLNPPMF